jgi:hypothetical protein
MRRILTVAALATATFSASLAASTDQASAQRRWGTAFGIGLAAGVIAGSTFAGSVPVLVEPKCGWVDQYDRDGNYLGRVRVCEAPPN